MIAADTPQILQDENLSVCTWSGADADGRNREVPGDLCRELRRHAFEHHRKTAQFFERMGLSGNLLRSRRIAPLHAESTEFVDRLRCQTDVPHHGNAGADDLPDDMLVSVNAFQLDRVCAASEQR